ncbi:MAG: uroporphyrinogen-III C-methyltransferase [Ignavibacteriaceae bacterium]
MKLIKIFSNRFEIENRKNSMPVTGKYSASTLPVLLRNPKILLIGGGKVALQKAKVLKLNNINFQVITLEIIDELKALGINYRLKKFESFDIKNFNIIIDATGDEKVRALLKRLKERKFFLLNSVDVPEDCDFYFSSLLVYKHLKIAVSCDGASPTVTQIVRDKIKKIIPAEIGDYVEKKIIQRKKGIVEVDQTRKETSKLFGKVFLVGCGPGSADLLTLRAIKIIKHADIIFHDNLVTEDVLTLAKKEVQIFCVGKEKGNHKFSQDEINRILVQYAKDGYTVARLKGGDPYIFGRGAEEAEYLIDNNVEVEVVPGISSSLAAPLLAGIPPTHREYSSGFSVVTCCCKDETENFDWLDYLKIKNHTTIVLMGLTKAEEILFNGIEKGISLDIPVAIISNASKPNQKVLTSIFGNIIEIANTSERPAVMVFGNSVKLHEKLFLNQIEKLTLPVEL